MSYQFKSSRTLPDNIRQIAAVQISLAREQLTSPPDDDVHEGIHEARKSFKRLRGLARMVRPALGRKRYRQENIRFRDAGRSISALRDRQALVESFDMLEQDYGQRVNFARMSPLRQKLSEQREHVEQAQSDLQTRIEDIVATLDASTADIANWQLENATAGDLARGMQRVYRRARKGWKRAQQTHDPDLLHDWRKRNKYLRYHFQLLKGLDKDWASGCHKGFKELSNLLGDHHDLEVLRGMLDEMDQDVLEPVAESEFRILLREKQDALYREALQWGDVLLKRKPKQMRKRVSRLLGLVEKT